MNLHGTFRRNATDHCQTCHSPVATDVNRRPEDTLPESIHFKYMVHKIHRGADLENLPYIVYGFGNRAHDYSDIHYPGDLADCVACHAGDPEDRDYEPTFTIPLPEGVLPTVSPAAPIPVMQPITATCLSCHDGNSTVSHALANTSEFGESCETCHGEGKSASVESVHAR
jgi:OmcA/MtrC family decaheme c-type cytochrome